MKRLLVGRAGSGKTHACLERLTDALRKGKRALLVVPTYSQAEHLRFLLLDRAGGLSAQTVETFSSLAERVTKIRLRDLAHPPVSDRAAEEALFGIFPDAAGQAGFRAEFLLVVKEIKEQGRDPDETVERARAHFGERTRGRRLFEAYARYRELLRRPDHEDLLLNMRDRLRAEPRELQLLLVDGFHDFTPVELEIVNLLAARADETVVTLPLDPDEASHPVFATAVRTAAGFDGFTREALHGNRRAGGALAELETGLFRSGRVSASGVEVIACASEEDEADRLARLVASSGRPFHDFLLVRRSFDGLFGIYRAAFRRHGVPIRFFGGEPLGHTPAARAVSLWLKTLLGPVPTAELLPLLRSPYNRRAAPPGEVDELARLLRVEGEQPWPAETPEGPLPDLLRRRFGIAEAVALCPDGDGDLARAARFFSALEAEAEALRELPLEEAAERLKKRIPLIRGTARDRRHDCVYAVDAMDARQWEKPVVLVAGLDALSFPRQVRQDLFLRDDERKAFGEERGLHLPLRSRKEEWERYLFYVALTRARERLVLTYPAFDEEGTARSPSPYLDELLVRASGLRVRRVPLAEQYVQANDAISREDLLPIVADGLARGNPLAASLYDRGAVARAELAWPRRLELLRARPIPGFPEDPAAKLSASSINRFRRCPYLFLMSRVLRVDRPRAHELNPLVRGDIVHKALERCARETGPADAIFDEVFAEKTRGFRIGLGDEALRRTMRRIVLRKAEEIRARPPEEVEHWFEIPLGDVTLRGRIDRIDRYGPGVVIRDYKTGFRVDEDDVQLEAYLLAVDNPAGAVYELLRSGDVKGFVLEELKPEFPSRNVETVHEEELEGKRAQVRAIVAEVAAAARAGRLAVHPKEPERCTRTKCDGYDLCRVARTRWLAREARRWR